MSKDPQATSGANSPIPERRSEARQPTQGMAMIESGSGESERFTAQIIEVSDHGIRVKVRYRFDEGSMVRIYLPCQELGPVTTVLACVMHFRHEGNGVWTMGCQFCTELNDEDLDSLGVQRKQIEKNIVDNRIYVRQPVRAQVLYRNVRSSAEPVYPGTVINASPIGIGLKVKEPVMPGSLLDLTVQGENGEKLFEILACVVYRHLERDSQYTVGCNFIRELNDQELGALS